MITESPITHRQEFLATQNGGDLIFMMNSLGNDDINEMTNNMS